MNDTQEERTAFATIMYGLAEEFGAQITDDLLEIRFAALGEYQIDQISQAATWLIKNRVATFPAMPRTKEIIDAIRQAQGEPDPETQAQIQVDLVIRTLKNYGGSWPGKFKDPITNFLMTNIWPYCFWGRTVKTDELTWWKKEFIKSYEAHVNNQNAGNLLPGTVKNDNIVRISDLANKSIKRLTF